MSYESQDFLTTDATFYGRVHACAVQQADTFKNDQRPPFVSLAKAVQKGDATILSTFYALVAAAPGLADKVETGDSALPFDQSLVLDEDILAAVQGNWEDVSTLYFDALGNPL